jgi:redox-sensitive bicupin YhaK (pirin superfamily)
MRTKCIKRRWYNGDQFVTDTQLVKGSFYTVLDREVFTLADETPWVRVLLPTGRSIERPRHLFGPFLKDER